MARSTSRHCIWHTSPQRCAVSSITRKTSLSVCESRGFGVPSPFFASVSCKPPRAPAAPHVRHAIATVFLTRFRSAMPDSSRSSPGPPQTTISKVVGATGFEPSDPLRPSWKKQRVVRRFSALSDLSPTFCRCHMWVTRKAVGEIDPKVTYSALGLPFMWSGGSAADSSTLHLTTRFPEYTHTRVIVAI